MFGGSKETQLDYWSRLAPTYDERFGVAQKGLHIGRKAYWIATLAGMGRGKSVLEIGCGTGAYSRFYAKIEGLELRVSDLSPAMVERARQKGVSGFVADAHNLGVQEQYDAIVGSYVLQYLDLDRALPEIRRALKPGGRAVFLETNTWNPYVFLRTHLAPWAFGVSREATSFTKGRLAAAFEGHWLTVAKIVPADVSPFCFGIPGSYMYSTCRKMVNSGKL